MKLLRKPVSRCMEIGLIREMTDINTALMDLSSLTDDKIRHLKDILASLMQKEVIESKI